MNHNERNLIIRAYTAYTNATETASERNRLLQVAARVPPPTYSIRSWKQARDDADEAYNLWETIVEENREKT